jgi:hypothetical protein
MGGEKQAETIRCGLQEEAIPLMGRLKTIPPAFPYGRLAIFSAIMGALPPARLLMMRFTWTLSFMSSFTILITAFPHPLSPENTRLLTRKYF